MTDDPSTLKVFPVNYRSSDCLVDGKLTFVIDLFGYLFDENKEGQVSLEQSFGQDKTEEIDSEPTYITLRVYDYMPTCYLCLSPHIDWNDECNLADLKAGLSKVRTITRAGKEYIVKPSRISLEYHRTYFHNTNCPFLSVKFSSKWALGAFVNAVAGMDFEVGESTTKVIPCEYKESEFNHVLKMFISRKVKYGNWIKCEAVEVIEEYSKVSKQREFITLVSSIEPLSSEEAAYMPIVIPSIMGFDIEQNSSMPLAFPTKYRPGDVIFMISMVYRPATYVYKNREVKEPKYSKILLVNGVCSEVNDSLEIICYDEKTDREGERKILKGFTEIFERYLPAVLVGHNSSSYDMDMMNARANNHKGFSWGKFSIIKDHIVTARSGDFHSKAYSHIKIVEFDLPGTMILDTCIISRREEKLRSYKLDAVAKEFVEEGKVELSIPEMFRLFRIASDRSNTLKVRKAAMREIGEYAETDAILPIKLFVKRNYWMRMCVMSSIIYMPMGWIYSKGMLKRVTSLMYSKCKADNVVMVPRSSKSEFSLEGGLVRDPIIGLYEDVFVLDLTSLYPTILEELNICPSTLENKNDPDNSYPKIPESEWNTFKFSKSELISMINTMSEQDNNNEGIVNSIIESKGSKNDPREMIPTGDDEDKDTIVFRWAKSRLGLVPKAERDLKMERARVKQEMKKCVEGSVEYNLLDTEQIADKLTANSLYGFLGFTLSDGNKPTPAMEKLAKFSQKCYGYNCSSGNYACIEAAICVTKRGREINDMITNFIHKLGSGQGPRGSDIFTVIYGDTDSVFIKVKAETKDGAKHYILPDGVRYPASAWKMVGKYLQSKVNSMLPKPHSIEFEKAFWKLLLKGKKNYVGITIDDMMFGIDTNYEKDLCDIKGKPKPIGFDPFRIDYNSAKLYMKGMAPVRRQDCMAIIKTLEKTIRQILKNTDDIISMLNMIRESIIDFLRGPPLKDLLMTIQIGKSYEENSNSPIKKFIELQLSEYGRQYTPGERIDYIFIKTNGNATQGDKMQAPDLYEADGNELDLPYYIEHRLANKLDQLLNIVFSTYPRKIENLQARLGKRIIYKEKGETCMRLISKYICPIINSVGGDPDEVTKALPRFTIDHLESKYKGIIPKLGQKSSIEVEYD